MNEERGRLAKQAAHYIGIVLIAILAGFLLLLMVYLIPQERMEYNTRISLDILLHQGGGVPLLEGMPETEADYFTDAVMLNTAYTAEGSLLEKALLGQGSWDGLPAEELAVYMQASPEKRASMELRHYARYWHGYLVFLRPLLMCFHINQIRLMGMIALSALFVLVIWLLCKTGNERLIPPCFALWIFLVPVITVINLQYYACTGTALLGAAVILARIKEGKTMEPYLYTVMELSGIATAFLDLLTFPSVSFGVPMILYYCLDKKAGRTCRYRLVQFLKAGLAWVFGYAGMMTGKWVLATVFTRENIIADGIDTVLRRSSGTWKGEEVGYLEVLQKNFSYYDTAVYKLLLTGIIMLFIMQMVRHGRPQWNKDICFALGLCMLTPFLWYMVTRNHAIIHSHFTFRTFSTLLFGCCMLLYQALPEKKRPC